MKHSAIRLLLLVCLYLGYTSASYAAFPIQHQQTAITMTKQANANAITQSTQASPKKPLINPEHEMGDILSLGSIVLGVLGIIVAISSGFGLVLGILAIVMGIAAKNMETGHRQLADWGLAAGIIASVIAIIVVLAG